MDAIMVVKFSLLGVGMGLLGGIFGVGGGVLMIPALVLIVDLTQKGAQTVSLAVMIPMALVAFLRYRHMGGIPIEWSLILVLAVFAIIGANLGATIVGTLSNRGLQMGFGAFLVFVGAFMVFKAWKGI